MPARRFVIHLLELVVLSALVSVLAAITSLTIISSMKRADCTAHSAPEDIASELNTTIRGVPCSPMENISRIFYTNASYVQSGHIMIISTVIAFSLLVFRSALRAMTWDALRASMTLGALQRAIAFNDSPSLTSAFNYIWHTKSALPCCAVCLVIFLTLFAIANPIILSAIYRTHEGALPVNATFNVGGSVGPDMSLSFNSTGVVGGSIAAGRALLNTATISLTPFSNIGVVPFIPQQSIKRVWYAQVSTIVAHQRIDCGPSAPLRVWNSSNDAIVTLGPSYFAPNNASEPRVQVSFAGHELGYISNDPHVTSVYLDTVTQITMGSIEAETTVFFLAANGTIEGAHQTIHSPIPSSRIASVDVLVCTSVARLEISRCTIEKGAFTACSPIPTQHLSESSNPTGGLDKYMRKPIATAITIAASPVTSCYQLTDRLPMWNYITKELLQAQLPPLSFLSLDILDAAPYHVPLTYVANAFFGQTMHALVQGMTAVWPVYQQQPAKQTVLFATSHPALSGTVLGVLALCALVVTIGSLWARGKVAFRFGVQRLMYMLREGIRGHVFSGHVESDGELGEGVDKVEMCGTGSRVDVVGNGLDGEAGEESAGGEKDSDVQLATRTLPSRSTI